MSEPGWPGAEQTADLYGRLARGDPVAPAEFVAAFLDPLVAHLRASRRHADDHLLFEAAEDALLSVIRNPAVYDPSRGKLPGFLRMAAERDLANALAKERRHHDKREDRDCVELGAEDGNSPVEDEDTDLPSFDDPALAAVVAALSDTERRVLDLMRSGERRTEVFAPVLGITDLPLEDHQREVKRVKDRIIKRLQRAGAES